MGKRELLIVVGFLVAGAIAYRVTTPPPEAGARGFSLSTLVQSWHRRVNANRATASVRTSGVIPAPSSLDELRLTSISTIKVTAGADASMTWHLTIQASGPDQDAARQQARAVTLSQDSLGHVLGLSLAAPPDARVMSTLELTVPPRLVVNVEGSRHTAVAGVRQVRLGNLVGDADVHDVAGAVTGSHHNGTLAIRDVGAANLALGTSKATLARVRGTVVLTAHNGECHVDDAAGQVTIDATAEAVTVRRAAAGVQVGATNGSVTVEQPKSDVTVDARRAPVTLDLDQAVPVTIFAAGAPVHVRLSATVPVTLDAVADGGRIDATDFDLVPEIQDQQARLLHAFGDVARVAIRAHGGDVIVASSTK